MSDMAEDIINGLCCSECGVYFQNEHGYPVLCNKCWEDTPPKKRPKALPKATEPEL